MSDFMPKRSDSSPASSSPSLTLQQKQFQANHSALVTTSILPTSLSHPGTPPPHEGEVMSLHQAVGGSQDSEDEEPDQPVVIRAGVDPIDQCPNCYSLLETGPAKAVNFTINLSDLSMLVDCRVCGVRVKLKAVLGERQRAFFNCGM
eukprot:GFUD01105956.1.p1 GENE.GFUD01105956.1~~GFUD01105956.1.p1  ORF type:complete len:147 (-),score=44.67 GFUD01105956.1:1-441(-)